MEDTYKTVNRPSSEILFKERKSKFYGYVFPVGSERDVKPILDTLRKSHPTANHVCHAWQLGIEQKKYRVNDDGEPNNSAGMPIYGQIQSFDVTNVLVAVVRIFGGTKLGVGGLIQAYRTAAKEALDASDIVEKTQETQLKLIFDYPLMNNVMRVIKKTKARITQQKMELTCELCISVPNSQSRSVETLLGGIHGVKISKAS